MTSLQLPGDAPAASAVAPRAAFEPALAGHAVIPAGDIRGPLLFLTGGRYGLGGTRAGNARARAGSRPRVVAFLRDAIAP